MEDRAREDGQGRRRGPAASAALVVLAVLAALCPPDRAGAAVPDAAKRSWFRARSEHFEVFSMRDPGRAAELAQRLEQLAVVLERTNPALRATSPQETWVFAFDSREALKAYVPGDFENPGGVFLPGADRDYLVIDDSPGTGAAGDETLCHEFIHGYLRHNLTRLPLWLNEGLATYYGTFRSERSSSAEIGHVVPALQGAFTAGTTLPMEQLLAAGHDHPGYRREGAWRSGFYSQSWAICHFLLQRSDEHAARFARYVRRLQLGHPPLEAFEEIAPRDRWPALLAEVKAYFARGETTFLRYTFRDPLPTPKVGAERVAEAEQLYRLGEISLAARSREPAGAEQHFLAALAADPLHARSTAALGRLADARGRTAQAESLYALAAGRAPGDAQVHVDAGRGLLRRSLAGAAGAISDTVPVPGLRLARARFARALELEPRNVEALAGYARSFLRGEPPQERALGAARTALELAPARLELAADFASLLVRAGRCGTADSLYRERVAPLGEAALTRPIHAAVVHCRLMRGVELERVGDAAGAASLVEGLLAAEQDSTLRALLEEQLRRFRRPRAATAPGRTASAEEVAAVQGEFDLGLAASRTRDYAGAVRHLERVLEMVEVGMLHAAAEEMLPVMRARLGMVEGVRLINAGQLERAAAVLGGIERAGLDDSTKAQVDRLLRRTGTRRVIREGMQSAKRGELAQAGTVFDSLRAASPDDDLRAYAGSLGDEVDARQAAQRGIELLRAGRLAEARARFVELQRQPMSAGMAAYVRTLVVHTDARFDLDRAAALAKAGRPAEARRLVEQVLRRPIGGSLRAYAESLARQLEDAAAGR